MCFLCFLSERGDGGIITAAVALIPVSGCIQLLNKENHPTLWRLFTTRKAEIVKKKIELPDSKSEFTDQGSQNVNSLLSDIILLNLEVEPYLIRIS